MQYVPRETILNIIDYLEIDQIEAFFITNTDAKKLSNDKKVLRYISDTKHLPYVRSFKDLLKIIRMDKSDICDLAMRVGDLRVFKHYMHYSNNDYILTTAIEYGNLNIVKYLVENGIEVYDIDFNTAAYEGHLDIVKYLFNENTDTTYTISEAIFGKHSIDVIKFLVENGVNISHLDIIYSIDNGYYDIADYLLQHSIKTVRNSVIINAAKLCKLNVIKYILDSRYKVSYSAITDAIYAAKNAKNKDVLNYLMTTPIYIM